MSHVEIKHDVTAAETPRTCRVEVRHRAGREISEQRESLPAPFQVFRHVGLTDHPGHDVHLASGNCRSVAPLASLTAEGVRLSRAVHADESVVPV